MPEVYFEAECVKIYAYIDKCEECLFIGYIRPTDYFIFFYSDIAGEEAAKLYSTDDRFIVIRGRLKQIINGKYWVFLNSNDFVVLTEEQILNKEDLNHDNICN